QHALETARLPWPRSPVALTERCVCLVPDAQQVVLFDPATAATLEKIPMRWPSNCAPQVVFKNGRLFLLIDGYELQSLALPLPHVEGAVAWLDAFTWQAPWALGKLPIHFFTAALRHPQIRWQRLLDTETVLAEAITLDEDALYFVSRNILQ